MPRVARSLRGIPLAKFGQGQGHGPMMLVPDVRSLRIFPACTSTVEEKRQANGATRCAERPQTGWNRRNFKRAQMGSLLTMPRIARSLRGIPLAKFGQGQGHGPMMLVPDVRSLRIFPACTSTVEEKRQANGATRCARFPPIGWNRRNFKRAHVGSLLTMPRVARSLRGIPLAKFGQGQGHG